MIAKRIEFRNINLSRFSKLINYITHSQGKNERVGEIRVTNCQSEAPAWAAIEAEAVQDKNKRTKLDKTYHLLVSFREGDYPAPEVLKAIEDRLLPSNQAPLQGHCPKMRWRRSWEHSGPVPPRMSRLTGAMR